MQLGHEQKLEVFSQLIELSTDAIIIWAPEEGIVFWNHGAQRLYGYSEEEVLAYRGDDLLRPSFSSSADDVYKTLDEEGHWKGDVVEVTKHGESVIVSARYQAITLEGRQVILAINRDVTQEREQVQRIKTQARLLELCPDAIFVVSSEDGVTFWNEGAERLYGYTQSDTQGHRLKDLLKTEYSQPYKDIEAILQNEGEWQGDVLERRKSGEQIAVSSSIQSYNHDGMNFYLIANRNITAQRAMQSELLMTNKELVISNRELDEFAYIATHDLKEPFRGIAINADILLREDLSEKAMARVRRMSMLCQRIDQLLSDLLYFSRLGNGLKEGTPIDLNDTISLVKIELDDLIREKTDVITIETELPIVIAEPLRIKTVFYNLIQNSLIYNDAACRSVAIGFLPNVETGGTVLHNVFYVRDNGIGIEVKNHEKIFQFFKRLNREEDYGFGTGAGLSFVKKIIEIYSGEISISSTPGEGTTFYFSLPLGKSKTL